MKTPIEYPIGRTTYRLEQTGRRPHVSRLDGREWVRMTVEELRAEPIDGLLWTWLRSHGAYRPSPSGPAVKGRSGGTVHRRAVRAEGGEALSTVLSKEGKEALAVIVEVEGTKAAAVNRAVLECAARIQKRGK